MEEAMLSKHLMDNYQHYYEEGDSEWRWLGAIDKAENIISLCSSYPHRSILEVGAGEGSVLKRLSERGFGNELYALEISSSGIERIKEKGISRLTECALFDGYNIPYNDKQFDLTVLSHVIEHVEYPRKLLYEASRVSKYIFVEVPLEDTLRLSSDFAFDKVGHINFYSPKTIRRLVQSCDLTVLNQKVTNPSKSVYTYMMGKKGLINYLIKEYLLRLLPHVAVGIFTYHSALICQKTEIS
jgi:ubiquinone/menaquinone biosynthesis C-methylase UbiE